MSQPIYYFDLGNTRAKLWRSEGGRIVADWAIPHEGQPALLLAKLPPDFTQPPVALQGASVLGREADAAFAAAAVACWGIAPDFARSEPAFGRLRNAYAGEAARLGVDRWMALIAVAGDGDCDGVCVVGCGTAITIDLVVAGDHKGGYILPGLRMMQEALLSGTGRVRFEAEAAYGLEPGNSTGAAVRHGALAAVVSLVERVARQHGVSRVVLSGGDAELVAQHLAWPCEVDPGLLLRGIMRYFAHRNALPT